MLERVSGLVTELHVDSGSVDSHNRLPPSWVAALATAALRHLAHQRPPMLAAVQIRWYEPHLDVAMLKALACFSGSLTRLELTAAQLPLQAAGMLHSLIRLKTLQLVAYGAGGRRALPPHIMNVLYRLATLEVLHVSFGLDEHGASSLAAALPRLPLLHSLTCRPVLTAALLASMAGLTGLTSLDLDYTLMPDQPDPDLRQLTRMHSLARLQLVGQSESQDARWPLPSHFPSLRSYNLRHAMFSLAVRSQSGLEAVVCEELDAGCARASECGCCPAAHSGVHMLERLIAAVAPQRPSSPDSAITCLCRRRTAT